MDIESSNEILGKDVGSDEKSNKATYPKVCGLEKSKKIAHETIKEANNLLINLKEDTFVLENLARFVIERVY